MYRDIFRRTFLAGVVALVGVISAAGAARADPPGRVARLSYADGHVSFSPAGENDWTVASASRPLTAGDRLWTDQEARAELHIGSTSLHLGNNTSFAFINLDDNTTQIQLSQGSMNFRVRKVDSRHNFEVDTPSLAFTVHRPGRYRIDVDPNGGSTAISVREGEGDAIWENNTYPVSAGQWVRFTGTNTVNFDTAQPPPPDEFDNWSAERDRRNDGAVSARYVSRELTGYEDLDAHGTWRTVPDYGSVWVPTDIPEGWAPYRYGHWAWIAPWGWTWVDDAPWGFAPFHYGRWAYTGGLWAWVPAPIAVQPVYAPALVAFVGGPEFGISLSFGGGGVGWFPLGPGELYRPAFDASRTYITNVNTTNTTVNNTTITNIYNQNITNVHYVNQQAPGAVTAVPTAAFTQGQPIGHAAVHVPPQALRAAQVTAAPAAVPTRASVLGPAAPSAARPPAAAFARPVVARTPPPPAPVPFEAKQQAVTANGGRPLAPSALQNLRPKSAATLAPVTLVAPAQHAAQPNPQPGRPPAGAQQGPQTAAPQTPPGVRPPGPPTNRPEIVRPNTPPTQVTPPSGPNRAGPPPVGPEAATSQTPPSVRPPASLANRPEVANVKPYNAPGQAAPPRPPATVGPPPPSAQHPPAAARPPTPPEARQAHVPPEARRPGPPPEVQNRINREAPARHEPPPASPEERRATGAQPPQRQQPPPAARPATPPESMQRAYRAPQVAQRPPAPQPQAAQRPPAPPPHPQAAAQPNKPPAQRKAEEEEKR
jgi:uncharacterized protein DUF6600/FecR-like protein